MSKYYTQQDQAIWAATEKALMVIEKMTKKYQPQSHRKQPLAAEKREDAISDIRLLRSFLNLSPALLEGIREPRSCDSEETIWESLVDHIARTMGFIQAHAQKMVDQADLEIKERDDGGGTSPEEMDARMGLKPVEVRPDGVRVYKKPMLDGRTRMTLLHPNGTEETYKLEQMDTPMAKRLSDMFAPRAQPRTIIQIVPRDEGLMGKFYRWLRPELCAEADVMFAFKSARQYTQEQGALDAITPSCRAEWRRNCKGIMEEIKMGTAPMRIALASIANTAGDLLQSGELCIYRGVLGLPGESMLHLFKFAVHQMAELKYITQADAVTESMDMDRLISEVG